MINIFTIVLNGKPYIKDQLKIFNELKCEWRWVVVYGYARPVNDTSWCHCIEDVPDDGTLAYLKTITDSRVSIITSDNPWYGKTEMCNAALLKLASVGGPGVLMQIDADESWQPWQLETIHDLLSKPGQPFDTMAFRCRYWVGPNRHVFGFNCFGNMTEYEWYRAWSWDCIDTFNTHEPPRLAHHHRALNQDITCNHLGLVFEHYAYSHFGHVVFKEKYYGYKGLKDNWTALNNQSGPVLVPAGCFGNAQPFLTVEA